MALMISHTSPTFRSINIAMTRSYCDHANPTSYEIAGSLSTNVN
jgi:hypothetical protein